MIKLESIPFVSIVIPTTGNVKFIKGLVESVSKLDYPKDKFELILIGDEETELLSLNSKRAKEYGIKTTVKYEPFAAGKKRNIGVELAKGEIIAFTDDDTILKEDWIKKCIIDKEKDTLCVKKGDLVRVGTHLTSQTRSKYAGQVYRIEENSIFIRLGRPYLVSEGTILRASVKSLVEKSDILATLVYEKLKTVDIVQGLPKVEEILEARKIKNGCLLAPSQGKAYLKNKKIEILKSVNDKLVIDVESQIKVNFTNGNYVKFLEPLTDGPISPHDKLDTLFNYYQTEYPVHEACKKSFKYLQLF